MEDYRLTQSGQEVQNILDGAAMQVDLTAETERSTDAEQTLQGNIDAEETRAEGAEGTLQDNIDAEEARAKAAEKQNADDIDAIEEKIPSGASSSNKLATEEYVNDSVATATATFRGTYNVVTDLNLLPSATHSQISASLQTEIATADSNDYAFVLIPTSVETPEEIEKIERYKYNGSVWGFEYVLNNSGFTAVQWAAINSGITSNAVGKLDALPNNAELTILLNGKQDTLTFDNVPTQGSSNPVKSGGVYSAIKSEETRAMAAESQVSSAIEAILLLIPSAASALNQLADKAFVNSSIATATATFRGTYNLVTDLSLNVNATHSQIAGALGINISTADNNDYAFVQIPTSIETPTEIRVTERYKFNGTEWAFEYDLNNSGFTSAQWAAINSGITIALVGKLNGLPTNAELTTLLNGKQDTLTFDNVPTQGSTNPVKSSGIYNVIKAITDLIPAEATAQNQLADKADVAAKIVAAIPSWKGQYDALTDLQAVTGAKAGDMGCVKTTDSDGHAVLTFYQYSAQGAWVVYYTLRHYAQNKPATTGTTGDYPYNGMGRIELQKNIVNGVNTLTQAMLTQQNTIYIIRYDFTLGEDITVPANCVLKFDGGSLSNGTIIGNNTALVNNELSEIFKEGVDISGSWLCENIYDAFFNVSVDSVNNTKVLHNLFALSSNDINNTIFISKEYLYNATNPGLIVTSNTLVTGGGKITVVANDLERYQVLRMYEVENVIIENLEIIGDVSTHTGSTGEWGYGIYLLGCKNTIVRNCSISNCWGDGINVQKSRYQTPEAASEVDHEYHCKDILIDNCQIFNNRRNNISIEAVIGIKVSKCVIYGAGTINGTSPKCGIDIEPLSNNNQIDKDIIIENCSIKNDDNKSVVINSADSIQGYFILRNCDIDNISSWAESGDLDIYIEDSKIENTATNVLYTNKKLTIANSTFKLTDVNCKAAELNIENSYIRSLELVAVTDGNINNSKFAALGFRYNYDSVRIYDCVISSVYFNQSSNNILFNSCKISSTGTLISLANNVTVNAVVFEDCSLTKLSDSNPFIGINHVSTNCYFINCVFNLAYTSQLWIPFDNYINCKIEAANIKTLHDNANFVNCNIITNNPIEVNDISNSSNIRYVFENVTFNTSGSYIKSGSNNPTFIKVFGGNISKGKLDSLQLSDDSYISDLQNNYSNYHKYVGTSYSISSSYACLKFPKISKGWVRIVKSTSYRNYSDTFTEEIFIEFYGGTPKARINVCNQIDSTLYGKLVYPKFYSDNDYMYIAFVVVNGSNAEMQAVVDVYSDDAIRGDIAMTRVAKSVAFTSIPTIFNAVLKDTLANIKAIDTSIITPTLGIATDTGTNGKPVFWTGTAWVDATGTQV